MQVGRLRADWGKKWKIIIPGNGLFQRFKELDPEQAKLSSSLLPKDLGGDRRGFIWDESGRRRRGRGNGQVDDLIGAKNVG